jgi:hypothetical protein
MADEVRSPLLPVTEGTAPHTQVMNALRGLELL